MKIETRDFGEMEIAEQDIVTFVSPIYGFEQLKEFVFLFEEENPHIVWLQSIENPSICFVMVDAMKVDPEYRPELTRATKAQLGEGEYLYWLIMVVSDDFQHSTVNKKSPVVLNLDGRRAAQTILDADYPIRCPLFLGQEG